MSASHQNKVVSYIKPKYKNLIKTEVETTGTTESKIVAEAVRLYYETKNKSVTLSKNSY